jgi:hypothetical protein
MRSVFILAVICGIATAAYVPHTHQVKYADKEFLHKQEDIFALFRHIYQPEYNQQLVAYAKLFNIEDHMDLYTNKDAVKEFIEIYEHGFLGKGETFNIFEESHREQVIALFHILYYAKDFDTFYKTAAWARYYINEGMFVYATTVALTHRNDFEGFILPPLYEIYPFYFINSEVISKAHQYKMQGFHGLKKVEDVYTVVIPHNYTGQTVYTNDEQRLSYFTEDIGLNSYYYYFHTDYPFWMGGLNYTLHKDRRGELYLFEHQQLLARYYLERLSNDLGEIPEFSWEHPVRTGYFPQLTYYNGHAFPGREDYHNFNKEEHYYDIEMIEEYEHRIRDAIDLGYVVLPNGTHLDITCPESIDVLGNMIQGNPDNVNNRYYNFVAMIAKILLGTGVESVEHNHVYPSVLEFFETAMRDPVFYQIYKRIIHYYYQFKEHLPHYTYDELNFKGVKIVDVEVDKLITYFDKYDVDITNAVDVEPEFYQEGKYTLDSEIEYKQDPFLFKARMTRLNHKPFTYKITVNSDKAVKGVVRTFIGPKHNSHGIEYHIEKNFENFFELDHFMYEFVPGKNIITRNSVDFYGFVQDRTSYYDLYKKIMLAVTTNGKFPLDQSEAHCGFPARLMLPKGKKGGMVFQMFFIVSEYHAPTVPLYKGYDPVVSCGVGSGARYIDSLPFGYPFDRHVDFKDFHTPNMFFEDVIIFHKKEEIEVNTVV